MSKQPNPTLIGAFALGGVALLALFVIIIAGDSLFRDRSRHVIYFEGSINGLTTGSSVMFRGVPIGYVTSIEVLADYDNLEFTVPVYVDIVTDSIKTRRNENLGDEDEILELLIDRGLRATLNTESFITGKLLVELDFHPDTEAVYRANDDTYPEIPSITSGIQAVISNAQGFLEELQEEVEIEELMQNIASAIRGIDELANSPDLRASLAGANRLLNSDDTQNLSAELNSTLAALRATAGSVDTAVRNFNGDLPALLASLTAVLDAAEDTLALAEAGIRENGDLAYQVNTTLREVEKAARSLRFLTDYLEQDPGALLRGKQADD